MSHKRLESIVYSVYWEKDFWLASLERALKTFAQALVALIGTQAVGILEVDWVQMLSVSAMAAVVSVLTSVASAELGKSPGPSLVGERISSATLESDMKETPDES